MSKGEIFKRLGLIVGPIVTTGGYILDAKDYIALGLRAEIWEGIGALIFFLSVIALIWERKPKTEASLTRVSAELRTRKSHPPFWSEIERAGQVWAFWYNGGDAFNRKIFEKFKRPNKLVLLDNNDDALLDYHVRLHGGQKDTLKTMIRDTTNAAKQAGIDVAYWSSPMPFTMTFFEPESQNGRVQVEFQIPGASLDDAPSVTIHRSAEPQIYSDLLAFFKRALGDDSKRQ